MYLFSINAYDTQFNVNISYHLNQVRKGELRSRRKFFTVKKLKEILSRAAQSISQYRNKGRITITFRTNTGRMAALLVSLKGRELTIITTLYNVKRHANDVFRGIPHYYLNNYTFTKPTEKELRDEFYTQHEVFKSKEERLLAKQESMKFLLYSKTIQKSKWK